MIASCIERFIIVSLGRFTELTIKYKKNEIVFVSIFCNNTEMAKIAFKGTVKLFIDFAEKDTFIIDKKRDVFIFFKFDP